MESVKEIERLMLLDNEELLFELGNEIRGLGASPAPKRQIVLQAKEWLTANSKQLNNTICNSEKIKFLANKDDSEGDLIMLVSAISDLIFSLFSGISPMTVAILIVREGLLKYCEKHWPSSSR